jgi:hypothetical protein
MAEFTIRVELHDADSKDYATLAANLATIRVTDVVTAGDGKRYKLPPAEYTYSGEIELNILYNAVDGKVKPVGRKYAIFITQSAGRIWSGLPPA